MQQKNLGKIPSNLRGGINRGSTLINTMCSLIFSTKIPTCVNGHFRWRLLIFEPELRDAIQQDTIQNPFQPNPIDLRISL